MMLAGFHPRRFALLPIMRYHENRYYRTIVQRRGGMGGQALSPPSPQICISYHKIRNSTVSFIKNSIMSPDSTGNIFYYQFP